jgi:hypothetical protein
MGGSSNFPHNPSAASAAADIPDEFEEAEAPSAEELLVLVRSFSLVVSPSPETFQPRQRFLIASKKQQGYRQISSDLSSWLSSCFCWRERERLLLLLLKLGFVRDARSRRRRRRRRRIGFFFLCKMLYEEWELLFCCSQSELEI